MRGRSTPALLLLLSLLVGRSWGLSPGFKICAFNVQNYTTTKAANHRVAHTLTRIIARCDICLLLEVKDPQGLATKSLLVRLNSNTERYNENHQYQMVSSEPLGSSSEDMQRYVFLFRKGTVKVVDKFQYEKKNSFVREPFAVRFQSNRTAVKDFILVGVHTEASQAVGEIDCLYDVNQELVKKWKVPNIMFLGDFNAGCAHMKRTDRKNIRLFTKPGFFWLIGDKVDTMVRETMNCPYDRIVVHGEPFLKAIRPYSAKVFNYPKDYVMPKERVLMVSDHFPLEVELKSSAHSAKATPILFLLSLCVIVWSSKLTL